MRRRAARRHDPAPDGASGQRATAGRSKLGPLDGSSEAYAVEVAQTRTRLSSWLLAVSLDD